MSLSYGTILRQAGLRLNALVGTTASALETTYSSSTDSSDFDSADFPFTSFVDACLSVEEKLATAIANVGNHPWRRLLLSQTADIAHEALIPSTDSSSNTIIGVLGSVFDSSDGTALTEMSLDDIRIAVRNSNSWVLVPVYGYKIDGNRIHHTRTNIKIDVCTYNRTTRATAIGTLTNSILLPDVLEEAYVSGIVSMMVRDDAFMQQAQVYRAYLYETLQMIDKGLTSVPPKSIPGPTLAAA